MKRDPCGGEVKGDSCLPCWLPLGWMFFLNGVFTAPLPATAAATAAPPLQMNDVDAQRGPSAKKSIKERALSQVRLSKLNPQLSPSLLGNWGRASTASS